jgi:hypothetical protein
MKAVPSAVLLFAMSGLAACAARSVSSEPPTPAPLDPVGVYSFSTIVEGSQVLGRVVIRGEPGSYTGVIEPTEGPVGPIEIYAVTVEGQKLTAYGDMGGDDLIFIMEFTEKAYKGTWTLGFDGGEVTGERIEP